MGTRRIVFILAALFLFACSPRSYALGVVSYVNCIQSSPLCFSGMTNTDLTQYPVVSAAGYWATGDKGGGTFARKGGGCTQNFGTIIRDLVGNCFYRIDPNWGPKEFGAKGGGTGDDTTPISNWLATQQPHIGDADVYMISSTLSCTGESVQGPSDYHGLTNPPPFVLRATANWAYNGPVVSAGDHCRLSGVNVDGNGLATAVQAPGGRVSIDGGSALLNGNPYNLDCTAASDGLMVKDTELTQSARDNVNLEVGCGNVRLTGDVISYSGYPNKTLNPACGTTYSCNGVNFNGDDITIADGSIWQSACNGVYLNTVYQVSIVGMDFNNNGLNCGGSQYGYGAAILLYSGQTVSISGNHFRGSALANEMVDTTQHGAHIYFRGNDGGGSSASSDVSLSGNTYTTNNTTIDSVTYTYPNFVYDAGNAATLDPGGIYENPPIQSTNSLVVSTMSPSAQDTVSPWLVLPGSGLARAARRTARAAPRMAARRPNPHHKSRGYSDSW